MSISRRTFIELPPIILGGLFISSVASVFPPLVAYAAVTDPGPIDGLTEKKVRDVSQVEIAAGGGKIVYLEKMDKSNCTVERMDSSLWVRDDSFQHWASTYGMWNFTYIGPRGFFPADAAAASEANAQLVLRFSDAGYTSDGTRVDAVWYLRRTYISNSNHDYPLSIQVCDMRDVGAVKGRKQSTWGSTTTIGNSALIGSIDGQFAAGASYYWTVRLYDHVTGAEVSGWVQALFSDLDVIGIGDQYGYDAYSEGVQLRSNYGNTYYVANDSVLNRSLKDGYPTFWSSQLTEGPDEEWRSAVVIPVKSGFTFVHRASAGGVNYDLSFDSSKYPPTPNPVKSPASQVREDGGIAEFSVSVTLPHVGTSNKPDYISVIDALDEAFDSPVGPYKVLDANGRDVSSNWEVGIDGRTLTFTTGKTGHGEGSEGDFTFQFKGRLRSGFAYSGYSKKNGYWRVPNKAALVVGQIDKTLVEKESNEVEVLVVPQTPTPPSPTKSTTTPTVAPGSTASFTVTQVVPATMSQNRYESISMSDELDAALDASKATVRVTLDGTDVSSNWQTQVSGRKVTATARSTEFSGTLKFAISAPVRQSGVDWSKYSKSSAKHALVPNHATVTFGDKPGVTTNTVEIEVPLNAGLKLQKSDADLGA